ncbi:MAG: metallophosphoesterase family protein [Bacteroidota bacterium]
MIILDSVKGNVERPNHRQKNRIRLRYLTLTIITLVSLSTIDVSAQHRHRHDGLHHWEIPSKDPDRIMLTFHGDPATHRAVTWRTDTTINKAVAQIAEATVNSKFTENAITVDATTETFDLGLYKGNTSLMVHYHSVIFEGLKPDKLYAYRVGDGSDYWSEWIQFQTAKTDYSPTKFVYFGDAQNDVLAHWSRVIRMAYQTAPDASFVIHAGDLINNAHRDYEWAEWYKAGGFIHSQWTAIPVVGNHEFRPLSEGQTKKLAIQWRPQFTLPVEKHLDPRLHETVYTVDYQNIRIIVLNSNDMLEEQTKYIEEQLETSTAKWNIITCHHSVFSPAKGRDFQFAREYWKPILDKYNVDLVLNGHDHTYARGHVPKRTTDTNEDSGNLGTVYVTSVSGPKQYSLDTEQMKMYSADGYRSDKTAEQTQFFQVITVENNKLTYVAYTALGEEYDRAVINKDFKTGKKKLQQDKE